MANRPWKEDEDVFASFSGAGDIYRDWLLVEWGPPAERLAVLGLNPSKADMERDDNTVRKVVNWAKSNGFGSLLMLNAYPFRATDPKDMLKAADPLGPFGNPDFLVAISSSCTTVAAWGCTASHLGRAAAIKERFVAAGRELLCWGMNKDGSPIHPLYPRLGELKVWK